MKLEQVLTGLHPSDAIGRKSWYMEDIGYMPRLRRSSEGFIKRNKNAEGNVIMETFTFSDEDRLADDWMIVQGNENPNS